jgi:hypothetical protein
MPVYVFVPALVVALLAGFGAAWLLIQRRQGDGVSAIEAKAQQVLAESETQAKEKLLEAKEEAVKIRTAAEQKPESIGRSRNRSKSAFCKRRKTSTPSPRTSPSVNASSAPRRRGSTN